MKKPLFRRVVCVHEMRLEKVKQRFCVSVWVSIMCIFVYMPLNWVYCSSCIYRHMFEVNKGIPLDERYHRSTHFNNFHQCFYFFAFLFFFLRSSSIQFHSKCNQGTVCISYFLVLIMKESVLCVCVCFFSHFYQIYMNIRHVIWLCAFSLYRFRHNI